MNHVLIQYLKDRIDWARKANIGVMMTQGKGIEILDALINECHEDAGECSKCSVICCPHKDPMHFHHDGCPSCSAASGTVLHEKP